jgi:hypothetical protein
MATYRVPVDLAYAGGGSPGVNIWHVRDEGASGGIGGGGPSDMIEAIHQFYVSCASIMSTKVVASFAGTVTTTGDSPEYADADPWSVTGTGGADMLPASQCLVVSWGTSSATRSGRGRTFVGPLWIGLTDGNGKPGPVSLNVIRTAAANLIADSTGNANGALVVYSPQSNIARDVLTARVATTYGVLRSRRD